MVLNVVLIQMNMFKTLYIDHGKMGNSEGKDVQIAEATSFQHVCAQAGIKSLFTPYCPRRFCCLVVLRPILGFESAQFAGCWDYLRRRSGTDCARTRFNKMATYIRRKLAKLMVKDDTPPSLTISRPEGAVVFTKKEQQRYTWLLQMLDSDSDEQLGGAEGAMFLRRSQLTTDQLREVWRLASGGTSKARLTKEDWLIACKLVAAVQHKGLEPSMAAITGVDPLPIADFHYDNDPDVEADGATAAAIPDGAIRVRLLNPTAYGTGLSKHVRYNVVTSTTLGHFPRREMSVWRRYSDFEWLHGRLTLTFPAAMIPLFPEKRVVGNTDDAFVAERAAGLEAYLQRVAAHPVLSTSADMLVFLDGSDAGLEAARSFIESVTREEADSLLAKAGDLVSSMTSRGDETKLSLKTDEAYVAVSA